MGEKVISGSSTSSKTIRGIHPRASAGAPARARAAARGVGVRVSNAVRKGGASARAARTGRVSTKSQAQIHEERMKNLRKAQRVRRKNLKEGRKMGANKGKR